MMTSSLDLALIGNCTIGALVDSRSEIVWACLPRMDSDSVFCSLLRAHSGPDDFGFFVIEVAEFERSEQQYLDNGDATVSYMHGSCRIYGNVLNIYFTAVTQGRITIVGLSF